MKFILFLVPLFLLLQCAPPAEKFDLAKTVLQNDSTMLRGLDIGDSRDKIIDLEQNYIGFSSSEKITCIDDFVFENDTCQSTISYWLNGPVLYYANIDLRPQKTPPSSLFESLRLHLNTKYGESASTKNYASWEFLSEHNTITVSLIDESPDQGFPMVSVAFFSEKLKNY